jgi:hypothetical protein
MAQINTNFRLDGPGFIEGIESLRNTPYHYGKIQDITLEHILPSIFLIRLRKK